jgi:hypothetical protein
MDNSGRWSWNSFGEVSGSAKKNYIPAMGSPLFERTSRGAERNINQGSVNSFSWVISCKNSQINRSLKNNHETNDITTEVVTVLYVHNIIFARCLSFEGYSISFHSLFPYDLKSLIL